ncbi:hypothetical protein F0562_031939 [Nyssa sinensis]|uniref:Uncharacterized protein n=1 Tax=Nyssa sinensis TaxID=561372 RepID=A0A5J5AXD7_9ASTE|nr:hypothetical protein F0562_031939 [Nyssa sinensis]
MIGQMFARSKDKKDRLKGQAVMPTGSSEEAYLAGLKRAQSEQAQTDRLKSRSPQNYEIQTGNERRKAESREKVVKLCKWEVRERRATHLCSHEITLGIDILLEYLVRCSQLTIFVLRNVLFLFIDVAKALNFLGLIVLLSLAAFSQTIIGSRGRDGGGIVVIYKHTDLNFYHPLALSSFFAHRTIHMWYFHIAAPVFLE